MLSRVGSCLEFISERNIAGFYRSSDFYFLRNLCADSIVTARVCLLLFLQYFLVTVTHFLSVNFVEDVMLQCQRLSTLGSVFL